MQALKGLVAGMAILIVIAMTTIAYGLYRKSDDPDFKFFSLSGESPQQEMNQPSRLPTPQMAAPSQLTAAPKAFGDILLSLPLGCSISAVSGDGSRIFLKLGPPGPNCERVMIVDANTGALLGTIKASP